MTDCSYFAKPSLMSTFSICNEHGWIFGFSGSLDANNLIIWSRWILLDVLIMSYCSRHISWIMKIFEILSSMEDKNDPKGISRHQSWRWRRGCERVEQHRLFLYICVPVCVWEYLLKTVCMCVCLGVRACVCLFCFVYVKCTVIVSNTLLSRCAA